MPGNTQASQGIALKPDVIIKSFSMNPAKVSAGATFDLIIEFWNKGNGESPAGLKYSQSCKTNTGGVCPVPTTTGTLPRIPAYGTQKLTLTGLKGKEGSYELTVRLPTYSNFYVFPIGPASTAPVRAIAPAMQPRRH